MRVRALTGRPGAWRGAPRAAGGGGGEACPYCGPFAGSFELGGLAAHLEEEHAFEAPAECPVRGCLARSEGVGLAEHLLAAHWGGCRDSLGGGDFGEEQPGQWQTPPLDPEFAAGPSGGPLSGRGLQALGLEPEHGRGDWEDAGEGEPDFDFDVRRLLESLPGLRAEGLRAEGLGLQLHGEPLWLEHGGASGGGGEEEDEEESAWAGQGCRRGDLPGQAPASLGNARPGAAGARTGRPREQPVSESQLLERAIQGQYATDLLLSALEL